MDRITINDFIRYIKDYLKKQGLNVIIDRERNDMIRTMVVWSLNRKDYDETKVCNSRKINFVAREDFYFAFPYINVTDTKYEFCIEISFKGDCFYDYNNRYLKEYGSNIVKLVGKILDFVSEIRLNKLQKDIKYLETKVKYMGVKNKKFFNKLRKQIRGN